MNTRDFLLSQRRSIRLKRYDYHSPGAYFVTMSTQGRERLFGEGIVGAGPGACPHVVLGDAGRMVSKVWAEIPERYPGVGVDEFVVMPDHVHGIVLIGQGGQPQGVAPTVATKGLSLPDIVHRFKSMTTKLYTDGVKERGWQSFRGRLWQRNYYEHIVRDDDKLNMIRQYIRSNPAQWASDSQIPAEWL